VALGECDEQVLEDVSTLLWRERKLLELLVFKLEVEQLLLTAGRARWVNHASREVEVLLEELRSTELLRAVQVEAAASELDMGDCQDLRSLAEASPEPWASIFSLHRQAFLELTKELKDLSQHNCRLLAKGRDATRAARCQVLEGK
jgi:hypothetical protein